MLVRMQRKGNPSALLVGMQTDRATLANSVEVPQKMKNRTTLWPSKCTTRYLPKGYKNGDLKRHMHCNVYSSIINNRHIMEKAQMSTDWWMAKEDVVYTDNGILLSHQKEWNLAIYTDVDGAKEYSAKQNKSEKNKHHMISLMWNLRNKTNEHGGWKGKSKPRLLAIENKLRVAGGEVGRRMG